MQTADTPLPASPRRCWKTILAVLLAIAIFVPAVAYFSLRPDLSPEDCQRLEEKKNIAVGYLENSTLAPKRPNRLAEAETLFAEIGRLKPGDPLPARNLAIARLLGLSEAGGSTNKAAAAPNAREAAQKLLQAEAGQAVVHLLAGKIDALLGDEMQASTELARAAELAPDDPTIRYELFVFYRDAKDTSLRAKAPAALLRTFRAASENLACQLMLLRSQAENKEPAIQETVAAMRFQWSQMPGLLANIAARSNGAIADPLEWLGRISTAAEQGNWRSAFGLAHGLANVALPESWAQSDLRRLQRHPLEYVLHDFQTTCPPGKARQPEQAAAVKLSESPAAEQPPALAGVRDLVLADFDLDQQLDLIVLSEKSIEVHTRNHGAGWRQLLAWPVNGDFQHLIAVDLDRDDPQQPGTEQHRRQQERSEPTEQSTDEAAICHRADLDLVIYGPDGIRLLRNDLNDDNSRSLNETTQTELVENIKDVKTVAAADFYHDGDLDLALVAADGLHLWSNRGDLTFTDITGRSQVPQDTAGITALVAVDWDHDVDLDLLTANASGMPAGYLENVRHGQFRWRPYEAGFEALNQAKTLSLIDADARGSWRLAALGKAGATLLRADVNRSGIVSATAPQQLSATAGTGLLHWDFNNDGNLDLAAWNGKTMEFFEGNDRGELAAIASPLSAAPPTMRACRTGDLDNDGDEDLAVVESGRVVLYSNDGGNARRWIDIELRAGIIDPQSVSLRCDHYGLGCLIEVRSGSRVQRRLAESAKTHFGLGDRDADLVRVIWTTGVPQDLVQPKSDEVICDEQVLLGSCPYLYTWNGERFGFYTDCLWSAPLGLLLAEGQVAPSRAWEYLRIDGDRLKERDGCYPLQITEELWEAIYLDEVRLIAVDHPAEIDIYSNEKVGPAELARHKIHTVRGPRRPIGARDQQGRDVLDRIGRRDGKYVKAFDRRFVFGLTEDHFVELDFGDLGRPRQVTLFLTGWIRPSGTSMNVAISQNPGLKPPAPPSLWVPDAGGEWREALPYMGFPGGKTKTIAVDLSGVFLTEDYRVRIATNMEIYWDEAFITVDETPAEVRQTPLRLVDANLHYRGFSLRAPGDEYGPEHYDYDRPSTDVKWPAMRGNFTRYGDVRELLTKSDDLLAVLGAGDEVSLRFAVPDVPLPPGWKRDFLLYNVGWDKDCDLNTIYGETVEPLPFATADGYSYSDADQGRDWAAYEHYLRTYQNRRQDSAAFWRSH